MIYILCLLGIAASNLGTADPLTSKTLCLHVPALLPPSHWYIYLYTVYTVYSLPYVEYTGVVLYSRVYLLLFIPFTHIISIYHMIYRLSYACIYYSLSNTNNYLTHMLHYTGMWTSLPMYTVQLSPH